MRKRERNKLIYTRYEEGYSQEGIGRFYNLAKAVHHLSQLVEKRKSVSMASIKTQYFNGFLLDLFISEFGILPKLMKNNPVYIKLCDFDKIAAESFMDYCL